MLLEKSRSVDQSLNLVRDLHTPSPPVYWCDLLVTAVAAWISLFCAAGPWLSASIRLPLFAAAVLAFYRGLCFTHEISHFRRAVLAGFETAWNLVIGVPMLLPSFMYGEVHLSHHKTSTYGTLGDPEYLPLAGKPAMIVVFILQGVLLPALLCVRAFVLTPLGLLIPSIRRWTLAHGSALSMNVRYVRSITPATNRTILRWELVTLLMWGTVGVLLHREGVLLRSFAAWYATVALVAVVNTLRTLGAHRYEGDGHARSRDAQLLDSIDTPGGLLTELWAPVGLRFHALHHYFPGIPYHNLRKAHERLIGHLPVGAPYRTTLSRSLLHSLLRLARGSSS